MDIDHGAGSDAPESMSPLVFPDPLTSTHLVSAATFLYFDVPVVLPSPIWIPDEEAFGLHDLVASWRPDWAPRFFQIDALYGAQVDAWKHTKELLNPLKDTFVSSLFAFDADTAAIERGLAFLRTTGETIDTTIARLDPGAAAGEVFHHLLIDKYVELDRDLNGLYEYCGQLFALSSTPQLLVSCYLPRLTLTPRAADASDVLLFNNIQLLPLLEKLPVDEAEKPDAIIGTQIVAWEIFARILAQQLDPLDARRVDRLADLRRRHRHEVESLKGKCLLLAKDMPPPNGLDDVIGAVERFLRYQANEEIAALFRLNRSAVDGFVESVLTDEKSWLAVATTIASAYAGQGLLTAGAGLATVSSLGAKAAKSTFQRRKNLRTSDYRVLYRIGRR
ncbi:hypothetical protein TM48_04625 [Mycobacterium shottsii]|uniref:Uncharacterized protein n=1 Tax=Mycobacterium shottsii TaxID=133549 RepID=A0A7I7LKZ0_9MYCO|nr:hypothetical protein [Mycobacterium shottsii]QYL30063.1 hypothetical protein TM48_04625 [Mycobacterium shottsii]BBX60518.1 hypothetical protein MSHO_58630 [Mycobacterium shottsii]